MTDRKILFNNLWKIADNLRSYSSLDGWEFKDYILGFMFYCYLSDYIVKYINSDEDEDFNYSSLNDDKITNLIKQRLIDEIGFFIYPSQLFRNVFLKFKNNSSNLNITLKEIFQDIENSSKNTYSEKKFKDLFRLINLENHKLSDNLKKRNDILLKIMDEINKWDLSITLDNSIDIFGDVYEFLIHQYSSIAGKSGGNFIHPNPLVNY